ncbi:MAG: type II toxin-antitoxin system YafQ family toxin [Spirochaetaceae bacterium]|nr:type II toxin-antitoxin system YafQ family toxin [Spirochaetaceae bacterium]
MKYEIKPSHTFKKELKQAQKRGLDISKLISVVNTLAEGKTLEAKYKDHALTGNYKGYRECHIQPDWLLIYQYDHTDLYLYLVRTGTHSDLF